jgi:hypothetical protein
LAAYPLHNWVTAFVPATGRFGFLIGNVGRECFIEPEELPAGSLAAIAAAANLPDAHNFVAVLGRSDSMDFDNAREAVISQLQAKTISEGVTSGLCVQWRVPNSTSETQHTTSRVGV